MNIKLPVIVLACFAAFTAPAIATDIDAGGKIYQKNCRACHGKTGKGLASYPKLAGQDPEYLIDKLTRYKAGERFGPNTALMAPQAKKLSKEDIANIAHYIATSFKMSGI